VLGYAGNREVASDAVAEAFAQLIRRGNAVRSPERWVWRAAFRVAAGELSRRERLKPPPEGSYEMEEPSIVLAALRRLSPRQRAAIVLYHYCGYSLREIGSIVGSSPATVGVHLNRARKKLRAILEDDDG
jgi:RNA polymerase sigma-70 factor (ECF subfamily)